MCPTRNAQREPAWQEFAGGSKGPSVDKLSFNSWWSGPPRGQRSPLLKPLVWRCLSSLSPCWLHKAKVLCDHLQALLFCFVLSVSYSLLPFFSLFSLLPAVDFGGTWGGYDRILTFLLRSELRFGCRPALSAFSRAHSHLRHAEIPVSGARSHYAEPDDCGWKMNCSAGICLTDSASLDCTRVKEAVRRRSDWPRLKYLLVFPFRCWKTEMGWHFYRCPWPTEPLNLYLPPINLEPRVHDVLSKQSKQPQGELEKEVNMKGNNDALCLHISRVGCGVLSAASHFHDFSHMAGDSSDVPASRHTVFRLSEANTDASLSFL